jgi:malonyl-CoA/methylmalonyl-CoA synthetase
MAKGLNRRRSSSVSEWSRKQRTIKGESQVAGVSSIPLIARAEHHRERTAIITPEGVFTYRDLLHASRQVAACLLQGENDLRERRVAYSQPPGFEYVALQWGIWRAGGIAVPLCASHPRPEVEYVIEDAGADTVVAHPHYAPILRAIARERGLRFLGTGEVFNLPERALPKIDITRRALILYTSGTTSKPKGVVTTHRNIQAQVMSLIAAWEWSAEDYILHVLPLHHIHGIINVLTCALWAGARCQMLPRFDAEEVWARFLKEDLTLFMAVPTIYVKLIAAWEAASPERQKAMSQACTKLRLMVSGSAALPVSVLEKWHQISGHVLLERYGMTEIGMGLSNPLRGRRVPGHVGTPLPGVEVRLVDDDGQEVWLGTPGEIEVRGPGVFLEYHNRPEATREAFHNGWFRTGDVAVVEDGNYRILGRKSVDIIKTGGFKVSALEIEEVLRERPDVQECAVVGVEDPEWGERVCAAIVPRPGRDPSPELIQRWARDRLAAYKVPRCVLIVSELPRNAMGKVIKPEVMQLFLGKGEGAEG